MEKNVNTIVTVKDWVITYFIMCIPIVNIVMLFVWAFGDNTNESKRNWAIAGLVLAVIFIVLYAILAVLGVAANFL